MTAKEYVGQIRMTQVKIKSMARQIQSLRDSLTDISPTLSDMPRAATPNVHRLDGLIAAKIDMERELEAESAKLAEINMTINALPDKFRILIVERYIGGLPWSEIAKLLYVGERQLFRLHGDALRAIDRILREREKMSVNVSPSQ